jgi:hypothetical protein
VNKNEVIGAVRVINHYNHTQHYECAAWWEERKVTPGIYPVTFDISSDNMVGAFTVDATVINDYFPALFGGVSISREHYTPKHIGEHRKIKQNYDLASMVIRTGNSPYSNGFDYYISPKHWNDVVKYLTNEITDRFSHISTRYNEWKSSDYDNSSLELLSVCYGSKFVYDKSYQLYEIANHMRFYNSNYHLNLFNSNTQWARDFLNEEDWKGNYNG